MRARPGVLLAPRDTRGPPTALTLAYVLFFPKRVGAIEHRQILEFFLGRARWRVFSPPPSCLLRGGQSVRRLVCAAAGVMPACDFTTTMRVHSSDDVLLVRVAGL